MTQEELKKIFVQHPNVDLISDQLQILGSFIQLKGLVGSGVSLVASAVMEQTQGIHVFIMPDKEEAAYFLNDLEQINNTKKNVLFFPESYKQPYQVEGTDNANVVMRTEALNKIAKYSKFVAVVTYPEALVEKVVTKSTLSKNTFDLKEGQAYNLDDLNNKFIEFGFEKVDYVYEPGQFSVRGGIIDIFSFSNDHPYRVEFFGDDIDSIRSFDPSTQLSVKKHAFITVIPNVQGKISEQSRQSLIEFIPESATIWIKSMETVSGKLGQEFDKAKYAYDKLDSPLDHLTPTEMYMGKKDFSFLMDKRTKIEFGQQLSKAGNSSTYTFNQSPQDSFNKNFDLLINNLKANTKKKYTNVLSSGQPKQIERLYNIFSDKEADVTFQPFAISIFEGFIDHDLNIACYTDHQIFERYHRFRLKEGFRQNKQAITLKEIHSLQKGDYVTHVDHGVGQFSGLEKIDVNGKSQEAIRLVYGGQDILYVSIHSLHRISRYTGKDGTPPKMNKLGSPAWNNAKKKTKKKVKEIAYDLIKLYAQRKAEKGFAFAPDSYLQNELEASFIYEDTPDQLKATIVIKEDMESESPMDRLVCGDVGFGKTELAIRAAFKAVADNKQVAVLAPTTILSLQHYKNFKERLAEFPCTVDYVNRFKGTKQTKESLKRLKEGHVDIIIGTHKLAGKDVEFKDLGLLIIDEEQKFGVGVKDKLKTIKANVDTLTLTATPIPRTLQFSLMGARDMSILNTAPPNRVPVQTELHTFNEETIRDAVIYEVQRGGQVYFVNNRIQNIQEVAGMIQRLCPDVRIAIGHGQMDGKKLEEVMLDFMEGLYDVLIATTIIESGIDIPNANTIIINEAHHFGLSDLHQLRGRVGRSNRQAFCLLLCPPPHMLTSDARKRLQAVEQFSDLGSGFSISMKDLDIRGAGNLLGGEQTGFISDLGFDMYQKILQETIEELKENEFKELFKDQPKTFIRECQIETDLEILIPDDYVNQVAERLSLYKEMNEINNEADLDLYKSNLVDRFGPIPESTLELFESIKLRWIAKELGLERVIIKGQKMIGYFISNPESDYFQSSTFMGIIKYVQAHPNQAKLSESNNKFRIIFSEVRSVLQASKILQRISN